MIIALLQHHHEEHAGHIQAWATSRGYQLLPLLTPQLSQWPRLTAVDAVIVLGGEYDLHQRSELPWLQQELDWLAQALAAKLPLIGICLGAQLLSHLLGARVLPLMSPEFGIQPLTLSSGDCIEVLQAHHYRFELPNHATLLGSTPLCQQQIYRCQQVLALQCHLEWDSNMYQQLIGQRLQREFNHQPAHGLLVQLLDQHLAAHSTITVATT
ncbi:type 1 glutamine amidotransferase [Ferrimonas senticii]|uniref:type 1 glutamine amidotransferase n=1 Tax=Ferrimonas senticii TaxID=394566 RepID=UPI00040ECAA8|nr:type 1 glutamine amidotransferase [Ferrimonas senticii]